MADSGDGSPSPAVEEPVARVAGTITTDERSRPPRPARWARDYGPELLSGASDNDPTNVGTAASVGAQTGYQLSWVVLLIGPLLGIVQAIAAQVGAVTRDDMQSLTRKQFGASVSVLFLLSVVTVNVLTIAADLRAGAAGLGLLFGMGTRWLVPALGLAIGALLLVGRYEQIVRVLRALLVGFLAFGAAAVLARPDWTRLLRDSVVPSLSWHGAALSGALALVGTTLTSYVYVWETIERGLEEPPHGHGPVLSRIKGGAVVGAVFTALVLWCMFVASAATLGRHHEPVASAADVARALHPLAGPAASDLFALGLIASALVALPVLLATTAYVVGAHFGWRRGLTEDVGSAPAFYAVLAVSIVIAVILTQADVSVVGMLVVASIAGGLGTPLGVVLLVVLGRRTAVMGDERISRRLAGAGWTVAGLVGALGVVFLVTTAVSG